MAHGYRLANALHINIDYVRSMLSYPLRPYHGLLGGRWSDLSHTLQSLETAVVSSLLNERGVGTAGLKEEVGVAVAGEGARDPGVGVWGYKISD